MLCSSEMRKWWQWWIVLLLIGLVEDVSMVKLFASICCRVSSFGSWRNAETATWISYLSCRSKLIQSRQLHLILSGLYREMRPQFGCPKVTLIRLQRHNLWLILRRMRRTSRSNPRSWVLPLSRLQSRFFCFPFWSCFSLSIVLLLMESVLCVWVCILWAIGFYHWL